MSLVTVVPAERGNSRRDNAFNNQCPVARTSMTGISVVIGVRISWDARGEVGQNFETCTLSIRLTTICAKYSRMTGGTHGPFN